MQEAVPSSAEDQTPTLPPSAFYITLQKHPPFYITIQKHPRTVPESQKLTNWAHFDLMCYGGGGRKANYDLGWGSGRGQNIAVWCAMHIVQCAMHTAQCAMHTAQCACMQGGTPE